MWTLLFTIVVPTRPRGAVVAALASVSSVPVIVGLMIGSGAVSFTLSPVMFFQGLVLPYLLVVCMAYVGARVVYSMGTEIKRARELGSYRLEEKLERRDGRSLAGPAPHVGKARRDQAHPPVHLEGCASRGVAGGAQRRFEREAQVIARLRSPHTVELFDFGVAADGSFYYVMELLDGLDANTLLRRFGPIPPERAVYLLRQICHSLSEAESCGLVHRDIKPANIFLCRYGEDYDFVKVLDFGLVKAFDEPSDHDTGLTRENVGARYAGVHRAGAGAGRVHPRWPGRHLRHRLRRLLAPDRAARLSCRDLDGTSDAPHPHATGPPVGTVRATDPACARPAGTVLLAKDPADRPQSARELSLRLAELDDVPAWTQERARDWWVTHQPAGGAL